jgi:hypothetical protein
LARYAGHQINDVLAIGEANERKHGGFLPSTVTRQKVGFKRDVEGWDIRSVALALGAHIA